MSPEIFPYEHVADLIQFNHAPIHKLADAITFELTRARRQAKPAVARRCAAKGCHRNGETLKT